MTSTTKPLAAAQEPDIIPLSDGAELRRESLAYMGPGTWVWVLFRSGECIRFLNEFERGFVDAAIKATAALQAASIALAPDLSDYCANCGQTYGAHTGIKCPIGVESVWRQAKPAAVAVPSVTRLLKDARHRIANLTRASVPFDDPLDGPVLAALDAAIQAAPQPPVAAPTTHAASTVPVWWKLDQQITEEMHVAACKVLLRAPGLAGLPQRMLNAMLAAAPRPPVAVQEPVGEVESAAHGAGGFHVRLAHGAVMPAVGTKLYTHPAPQPAPVAQGDADDAARYRWLRNRDLNAIHDGGVFAGMTPQNVVLNGDDLDAAIDAARAQAKEGGAA